MTVIKNIIINRYNYAQQMNYFFFILRSNIYKKITNDLYKKKIV